MKIQPHLIALTAANIVLMTVSITRPGEAGTQGVAPVLRGRALEIVDDRGRVRATISVIPADPTFRMPGGAIGSPETVLLRLINANGRPNVKIEATDFGAAIGVSGEADPTNIHIAARRASASLSLTNKDGHKRVVKPQGSGD